MTKHAEARQIVLASLIPGLADFFLAHLFAWRTPLFAAPRSAHRLEYDGRGGDGAFRSRGVQITPSSSESNSIRGPFRFLATKEVYDKNAALRHQNFESAYSRRAGSSLYPYTSRSRNCRRPDYVHGKGSIICLQVADNPG